jgi:hypothetical protein
VFFRRKHLVERDVEGFAVSDVKFCLAHDVADNLVGLKVV